MKKIGGRVLCLYAIGLCATWRAQADLFRFEAEWLPSPFYVSTGFHAFEEEAAPALSVLFTCTGRGLDAYIRQPMPFLLDGVAAAKPAEEAVRTLPPPPNSAALCLCAFGCLGAWQVVRSAKKWNWHVVPEWYHAGAPAQVGHVHVFVPDSGPIPTAHYDGGPALLPPPQPSHFIQRATSPVCYAKVFLTAAAPRGPPGRP